MALAAALLLALQSFLAAFTLGAAAAAAPLDAFGNPICAAGQDAGRHAPDGNPSGHGSLPACCKLGCSAASSALAVPPAGTGLAAPFAVSLSASVSPAFDGLRPAPKHRPGNPRAPPAAA